MLTFKTDNLVETKIQKNNEGKKQFCIILEKSIKHMEHVDKVVILNIDYSDQHLAKLLSSI